MSTPTQALRIEGEMTIYRAAELKQQMQPLFDAAGSGGIDSIDLSGVTEIDCSGVQLLLLARRNADAAGRALRLAVPSAAVAEVFALLNLGALAAPAA